MGSKASQMEQPQHPVRRALEALGLNAQLSSRCFPGNDAMLPGHMKKYPDQIGKAPQIAKLEFPGMKNEAILYPVSRM